MNIDDLKDAWNHDEPKGMQLALSTEVLTKTTSAVGRIRKNMKTEFIAVSISYVVFVALMFYGVHSAFIFNVAGVFMFIILVLNGFYFFRFYLFYNSMGRYDLNMKSSIGKIAYELELNTEIYKTYNFCTTPVAVLIAFILLCGNTEIGFSHYYILSSNFFASPKALLIAFAVILASFIVTYICINIHINTQYGKYLTELKQVVEDLGNEG